MRRFVIVGQRATGAPTFLLDDLAGTSGRLDVLLRCLRAALMVSHGLRRDAVVYLVLLGDPESPRALRFTGADAKFLRPEERALAVLVKKVLAAPATASFTEVRPGIAMAAGGLDAVVADIGPTSWLLLEEGAPDVRDAAIAGDVTVLVGDHLGFDAATRARIAALGAVAVGLGPVSLHAEDAVAVVSNEMDRRAATCS
jgi:tRNA (pseudouridine54-N1)-methyltransferase